jgi:hypothetical protein
MATATTWGRDLCLVLVYCAMSNYVLCRDFLITMSDYIFCCFVFVFVCPILEAPHLGRQTKQAIYIK